MLALDDPLWDDLQDAYGSAKTIPHLLAEIKNGAPDEGQIWFNVWSALAHQGDVYQASFAAVPHVVEVMATHPEHATSNLFGFVSWVEICRVRHGIEVDPRLADAYQFALARIPELALRAPSEMRTAGFSAVALSAIASAWGVTELAEAIQELDEQTLPEFRIWLENR